MIERQVSKRYARAFFKAAKNKGIIDQISEELGNLRAIIASDDSLINFLDAPQINDADKSRLVDDIFKNNFSQLIYSLVLLAVEKRRSRYLVAIIDEFIKIVEEEKGIIRAKVTTAVPLDLDLRDSIVSRLETMTSKKVVIFAMVDRNIIGGVIINMGNQVIDDSVRFKLNTIKNKLISLRVH